MTSLAGAGIRALLADAREAASAARRCGRSRASRRLAGVVLLVFWVLAVGSGSAGAVFSTADAAQEEAGSGAVYSMLSTAQDAHGLRLADYDLSVASGGIISEPLTVLGSIVLNLGWGLYRLLIGIGLWLLEVVVDFTWLDAIRVPAEVVANVLQTLLGGYGLVGAVATFSVLVSAMWLLKGRTGAGLGEMLVTMVLAGVFATALSNPVTMVTGDDGLLIKARDLGTWLTGQMMGVEPGTEEPGQMPTGEVMQALVRTPHQFINYGMHLDAHGEECIGAYNEVVGVGGEYGDLGGACPQAAVDTAEAPFDSIVMMLLVGHGAGGMVLFMVVLCVALLIVVALVCWESAKFVWELFKAIMPGASRAGVFTSLAAILTGSLLVVGGLMSVAIFILVLRSTMTETDGMDPLLAFLMVDLMMFASVIVLIVVMYRGMKGGTKFGQKVAQAMSPSPTAVPAGSGGPGLARTAGATYLMARRHISAAGAVGGAAGAGAGRRPAGDQTAGVQTPRPRFTGKDAARYAAKGAVGAVKVGFNTTLGAPVAAPRYARAAKTAYTARKVATGARLAKASRSAQAYQAEYRGNVVAAGTFVRTQTARVRPGRRFTPTPVGEDAPVR